MHSNFRTIWLRPTCLLFKSKAHNPVDRQMLMQAMFVKEFPEKNQDHLASKLQAPSFSLLMKRVQDKAFYFTHLANSQDLQMTVG